MLKNYFLISIRNLKKQKLFSFINITGLLVFIIALKSISIQSIKSRWHKSGQNP